MWNASLNESQAGTKVARRNINNLRYADDTILTAKSKEELRSLLMRVKESEKFGLKLSIQNTNIMASGPITSWQIISVAQLCPTLCNLMDCSTPALPVHHQLPEFTHTHVHWVVMPFNRLTLCCLLFLPPSIFPSIRVFSNESVLRIRWPKYWSFSFSISLSNEYSGQISFRKYLWKIDGEKCKQWQILFSWGLKSLWVMTTAMKLKEICSLKGKLWQT